MNRSEQLKYVNKFYRKPSGFQKDLRKDIKALTDYISIGGILFTQESYDICGREVIYTNVKELKSVYVTCGNRYDSTKDVTVEIIDACGYRNDINFAE